MEEPSAELTAAIAVWSDYRRERPDGADAQLARPLRDRVRAAVAAVTRDQPAPLPGEPEPLTPELEALASSLPLLGWSEALGWTEALNGGRPFGDFGLVSPRWQGRRAFGDRFVVEEPAYRVTRRDDQQWAAAEVEVRGLVVDRGAQLQPLRTEGARWITPAWCEWSLATDGAVCIRLRQGLRAWSEAHLRMVCERLLQRGVRRFEIDIDHDSLELADDGARERGFVTWLAREADRRRAGSGADREAGSRRGDAETGPASRPGTRPRETILAWAPGHFRWNAPRPGWSLLGTVLGTLVVTDRRFLFLSDGEPGIYHGREHPVTTPAAGDVDFELLANPASLDLPLVEIQALEVTRGWLGTWYLSLRATGPDGAPARFCFMSRGGDNVQQLDELAEAAGF